MTHSFHRGSLALDFVGTVGFRRSDAPLERIGDTASFVAWLREAELVERGIRVDEAVRERALVLRETIARIGFALVADRRPASSDVDTLNAFARDQSAGSTTLTRTLRTRREASSPLTYALGTIAADAVRLFAFERARLVRCELPECGGLVLCNERGERRRWCSMELCGNRAKVAAHRRRRAERTRSEVVSARCRTLGGRSGPGSD